MIKLKDILNELKSKELGDYVFTEPPYNDRPSGVYPQPSLWQYFNYPGAVDKLIALQGGKEEENTEEENDLLLALIKWLHMPRRDHARELGDMMKKLVIPLASKYPKIFKPRTENGTYQFRGTALSKNEYLKLLTDLIKRLGSEEAIDALPVIEHDTLSFIEVGGIQYQPRSIIQSWSSRAGIALRFAKDNGSQDNNRSVILRTKQDDSFYFNQDAIKILFDGDEDESIHFGKSYKNNVTLLLHSYDDDGEYIKSFMKKILSGELVPVYDD